jgi:hypothetical protein
MSDKQARAVGGSCLGGVLGGVLGVIVGGFLGPVLMGAGQQKTNTFLDLQSIFVGFLGLLMGYRSRRWLSFRCSGRYTTESR